MDHTWLTERPIAHRGLHQLERGIPENSLAAFEAAVAAGLPIELDVQRLGDGTLVAFHDHDLLRATGAPLSLEDLGAASLTEHRLFGTDQPIPRMEQVLEQVAGRVPLLVELKNPHGRSEMAPALFKLLDAYQGPYAVQSFDPYCLGWFARHAPRVLRGQLGGPLEDDPVGSLQRFASRSYLTCLISRPHFLNYDLRALPDAWVSGVSRCLRIPLLCWTVRSRSDRAKADLLGVNYVFDHHG